MRDRGGERACPPGRRESLERALPPAPLRVGSLARVFLGLALSSSLFAPPAQAKLRVVCSTSDLAHLAKQIGGELVEVSSIAPPNADLHFVEVRPSSMVKVAQADVAFKVGMELDLWMDRIIDGSRNSKLIVVDCSAQIEPLEVPSFEPDARHGDLHRHGNPHYWLGPRNLEPLTRVVADGLAGADGDHAETYQANRAAWLERLSPELDRIRSKAAPLQGVPVVFYHNSWPYFCADFGLEAAAFVEPYPGVPPSPTHVKGLIDLVRARGIRIIAVEPYFDLGVPRRIAAETGARVVTLYPSIGGRDRGEDYLQWLEGNVDQLLEALP